MCRGYKKVFNGPDKYTVDGEILLLPVLIRHVENSRTWLPIQLYYDIILGHA